MRFRCHRRNSRISRAENPNEPEDATTARDRVKCRVIATNTEIFAPSPLNQREGNPRRAEWAVLDLNQRPKDSGLCEFPHSPDYLITPHRWVGCRALVAVIKGLYPPLSLCTFRGCVPGLAQDYLGKRCFRLP